MSKFEAKRINQKVKLDIHPDGDIYVWNKKRKRYELIGMYISKEFAEETPIGFPIDTRRVNKFVKALKNSV